MAGEPVHPTTHSRRTTLHRHAERGAHDRSLVDEILDEGLICDVGFTLAGSTYVQPTIYARVGDVVYLHGATGNRMLRALASGVEACLTVTLVDGLVFARSAFHHSMNYRCVMIFGRAQRVTEIAEKTAALAAVVDHVAPGRSRDARPPTSAELRATLVVRIPIVEFSTKVRTGGPVDDPDDLALTIWAGEVPMRSLAGPPVTDPAVPATVAVPQYVADYPSRRRAAEG